MTTNALQQVSCVYYGTVPPFKVDTLRNLIKCCKLRLRGSLFFGIAQPFICSTVILFKISINLIWKEAFVSCSSACLWGWVPITEGVCNCIQHLIKSDCSSSVVNLWMNECLARMQVLQCYQDKSVCSVQGKLPFTFSWHCRWGLTPHSMLGISKKSLLFLSSKESSDSSFLMMSSLATQTMVHSSTFPRKGLIEESFSIEFN